MNDVQNCYSGTKSMLEGVGVWTHNLETGTVQIDREFTGGFSCDATGYYSDWVDWLWFVLTKINGTSEDLLNYRSFLDLKAARGGLTLARWYGDQVSVRDVLNQLKQSAQFFFFSRPNGEYFARALDLSVPNGIQRFYNEDLTGLSVSQSTSDIYYSTAVRYREQSAPKSEKYAVVSENRADYEHSAKNAIVIEMMETVDADAVIMVGKYADILKKPLEVVRVTLPARALMLEPTDKIYLTKSIIDNDGTTRTIYSDQVFIIMEIEKNLNACTATVTAVKSDADFYWTEAA
jgi:hypothetical protein